MVGEPKVVLTSGRAESWNRCFWVFISGSFSPEGCVSGRPPPYGGAWQVQMWIILRAINPNRKSLFPRLVLIEVPELNLIRPNACSGQWDGICGLSRSVLWPVMRLVGSATWHFGVSLWKDWLLALWQWDQDRQLNELCIKLPISFYCFILYNEWAPG